MSGKKPSAPQAEALAKAADAADRMLIRWPGGYWTTQRPDPNGSMTKNHCGVPSWSCGTNTVYACEERGWLKRANIFPECWKDGRVITDAGLLAIGRSPQ